MNVLIVNHSDSLGGASVVSRRLLDALVNDGVDARMLVARLSDAGASNPRIALAGNPLSRKAAFLAEEAWIFANNGFCRRELFKVDAGRFGLPLHRHPWVRDADVIMLNWVNQGMLSLGEIAAIAAMGKRMVWTMHDMWPLTGICHHAGECKQYTEAKPCLRCPFVHGAGRAIPHMPAATARRKMALYDSVPDMEFVAVSSWLGDKARESMLTAGRRISVIPNGFPVETFPIVPAFPREALGLPATGALVVMAAARLDDPVKGLDHAVEALNLLDGKIGKGECPPATAVLFGELRHPELLDALRLPHVWLGPVSDRAHVAAIYAHASAVLSTSLYETLPGTLVEGQAAGAWPVSYDRGGQRDIISDSSLGTLVPFGDCAALADGLVMALTDDTPGRRSHLRRSVALRFSAQSVARRYIGLLTDC